MAHFCGVVSHFDFPMALTSALSPPLTCFSTCSFGDRHKEELLADVEHELGRAGGDVVEDALDDGEVALAALKQHAKISFSAM